MTNKLTKQQEKGYPKSSKIVQKIIDEFPGYTFSGMDDIDRHHAIPWITKTVADEIARAERKAVEDFVDYATIRDKGTIKIIDEVNDYLHTTKYYYLAINKKGEK